MPLQDTIAAADAVVLVINAGTYTEAVADFTRTFVPEFEADELPAATGLVYPSGLNISKATRTSDNEDSVIEIGIGRKLSVGAAEATDIETQLATVEEVKDVIRAARQLTLASGEILGLRTIELTLFVPELLRKRLAVSVIRVEYRGFS